MTETTPRPQVDCVRFTDDGSIPNNPELPLLLYRNVLPMDGDPAAACEARFAANGWTGGWRNGIYSYHHYHSTAHEVLGIVRGDATVQLGGEQGSAFTVRAGDVVVIPAGVGHKNLGASPDFFVVGAYPDGTEPDLRRGRPEERRQALDNIARVPLPTTDPVQGQDGSLLAHWRKSKDS